MGGRVPPTGTPGPGSAGAAWHRGLGNWCPDTVGWERSGKKLGRNDFSLDSVLEALWKKREHDPVVRLSAR